MDAEGLKGSLTFSGTEMEIMPGFIGQVLNPESNWGGPLELLYNEKTVPIKTVCE